MRELTSHGSSMLSPTWRRSSFGRESSDIFAMIVKLRMF